MKNTPPKQFVEEYQKFYSEFVGKEYNYNQALLDLETHPLSNIDEQLAIFDDSKGPSQAQLHQSDIAAFFSGVAASPPMKPPRLPTASMRPTST